MERRRADAVWRCSTCNVPLVYDYHVVWRCPSCGACFTIAPGLTVSLPVIELRIDPRAFAMSMAELRDVLRSTGPGCNYDVLEGTAQVQRISG